jgi:methionine-rich copper-binding protein CopC
MPANTAPPRSFGRVLAAAVTALLLAGGSLLIASPASAHDELISTDPAADAAVDALPAQMTFTFSGELATDPGATELLVTDAEGTSLADGDPLVEGTVVTQPLSGEASGIITVLWKVVSSDGHPISGELAFTVTAAPAPTPTETPTPSTTPTETPTDVVTPAPSETPAPTDDDSSFADVWPWVLGGILVAGIGGAVLYLLVSRARRQSAQRTLREGAEPPANTGGSPPADR